MDPVPGLDQSELVQAFVTRTTCVRDHVKYTREWGHRLCFVAGMVHANMNRGEYMAVVDYILEIFDPQDRESTFLETANAWKDLM